MLRQRFQSAQAHRGRLCAIEHTAGVPKRLPVAGERTPRQARGLRRPVAGHSGCVAARPRRVAGPWRGKSSQPAGSAPWFETVTDGRPARCGAVFPESTPRSPNGGASQVELRRDVRLMVLVGLLEGLDLHLGLVRSDAVGLLQLLPARVPAMVRIATLATRVGFASSRCPMRVRCRRGVGGRGLSCSMRTPSPTRSPSRPACTTVWKLRSSYRMRME